MHYYFVFIHFLCSRQPRSVTNYLRAQKFKLSIMTGERGAYSDAMTSRDENKKRTKVKGRTHGLHFQILDDPNIKAESNWEKEKAEYWTSKMCKKYVKMYHIDNL